MSMCLILSISIPSVKLTKGPGQAAVLTQVFGHENPSSLDYPEKEAKVSALIALAKPGRCIAPAALSTDYPHTVRSRGLSSRPCGLRRIEQSSSPVADPAPV